MPYSGSTVDEQVVKMSFDNSNFDGNIDSSIKALNNLDNKLLSVNKSGFASITNSVNNLANTFTVKGQIMFGVLTRLGNEIVSLGNKAFRKLTQGIRDGLGEYNKIIESTQTIYQNVKQDGNSIEDVNDALDELNEYADKTIYNFGQMTRMIGMFTSAGVSLDKSVSSIKGLSNAAALVGATMERAQIGWQAVSRAMSSGKFTNVTWRSLELSGIAGKQFNKVITEVARTTKVKGKQTGKDIDGMIKKWGSLRESLREGWLTKDIFTEAMDIMSGAMSDADLKRKGYTDKQIKELRAIADAAEEAATRVKTFKQLMETTAEAIGSGWAQSFRILIGDLEETKKLYTRISDVLNDFIDNNAKIRNKLFKQIVDGEDKSVNGEWKTGRDNFKQIIENMLAIVKTFLKSVKTGFYNIFPIDRISAAARKVLDIVQNFTRAFVINNKELNSKNGIVNWDTKNIEAISNAINDLIRFFRGLASVADIAWMAISQPVQAIVKRIPFFNNFFENTHNGIIGIVNQLGKFGDKITVFRNAVKNTKIFGAAIDYLIDNIDVLGEKYPVLGAIVWVFNSLKKAVNGIKNGFKELNIKPLSAAFGLFKMVVTAIWKVFNSLFGLIKNAKNSVDWSWLEGPKNFIVNLLKSLSDYGRGLTTFKETTEKIGGSLGKFFSSLNKIFNKSVATNKIVTATSEVNKQYSQLNLTIDKTGKKIQSVWDKIKNFFKPISEYFKNLKNNGELTFDGIAKKIGLVGGGIAAATIGISHLVKTVKKIKIIDNINELLGAGIDVLKAYQKQAQSKMILNIAIAVGILAAAMAALAFVPYDKLENGLTIFTAFMAVLATTLTPIINSVARLNEALAKNKKILTEYDVLNNLTNQVGQIGLKLAKGFNKQSLGKMFKDVAFSILILVGALSALVLLFKFDKDNTITAIKALAKIILILAGAVGVLVLVMNLFSKTATNFAGTFSQFAKLAGVSGIIISMSLAVLILVGAMTALSKIKADRLESSFIIIVGLMTFLGAIAVLITGIASNASSYDKLKKISIKITGAVIAVVAIAAAFALLVKYISQNGNEATWLYALAVITTLITVFMGMVAIMIQMAARIQDAKVFKKLNSLALVMTGSILAIAGAIYLLGTSKPIPASVVTTIGILAAATSAVLIFMGLFTAKANSDFSTKFVKVIEGIAFAISSVVASFGILTAGVAALIAAINSVDISNSDSTKASNKIINKVKHIAEVISKALPELKKLFYSIGQSVGTVFVSFTNGFIDRIVEVGDKYNKVIEKVVNLIIDLLGKVIDVLHRRRDDIGKIIGKLVEFLAAEIAAAVNAFFKNTNGKGIVTEDQVLKFLGIGALTTGGGAALIKIASNFNTIKTSVKNLGEMFNWINQSVMPSLIGRFKDFAFYVEYGYWWLVQYKNGPQILNGLSSALKKLNLNLDTTANMSFGQIAIMILAIAAAVVAVKTAVKGIRQLMGKEYAYHNANINTLGDAISEFFTNTEFRSQVLVYGMAKLGLIIITLVKSIVRAIAGLISYAIYAVISFGTTLFNWFTDFVNMVAPNSKFAKSLNSAQKQIHDLADSFKEVGTNSFKDIVSDWKDIDNFEIGKNEWTDEAKDTGFQVGRGYVEGTIEGIDNYANLVNKKLTEDDKKILDRWKNFWQINSPSKVTRDMYLYVMQGCVVGINDGRKKVENAMKGLTKAQKKILKDGAVDAVAAWNDILKERGITEYVDSLRDYRVDIYDQTDSTTKTVDLNKNLVKIMEDQKAKLEGLDREKAKEFLLDQARVKGYMATVEEAYNVVDAILTKQEEHTKVTSDGIKQVSEDTIGNIADVIGKYGAATDAVIDDEMSKYNEGMALAEEHKEELIGKKKEEVEEILKQEAIKRGMTEQEAENTAKLVSGEMFAGMQSNAKITQKDLENKFNAYKNDYNNFKEAEKAKTQYLNKMLEVRRKLEATGYYDVVEKMRTGQMTASEYQAWMKDHKNDAGKYLSELSRLEVDYNRIQKQQEASIKNLYSNAGMSAENINKMWNANRNEMLNLMNASSSKERGDWQGVKNTFLKMLGLNAGDLDTDYWNTKDKDNNEKKKKKKNDNDKAVKAAADTKKKLEANRADLTPTFDLDKLASDANKANGIVMSSLMAAQNASIGDYINKDSELNPFMKDRWQNVYNFTQNNYSPKALSRIDIYRQTQRQLSMSRGF